LAQRIEFIDFYTQTTPTPRESGKADQYNDLNRRTPPSPKTSRSDVLSRRWVAILWLTYQLVK
jgi:hypothetical protein